MKFICNKNILIEYINIVLKAVASKTTMDILSCILLETDSEGLILTANDMEISIKTSPVEAEVKEFGIVALDAKMFSEIIRKMPEGEITITTDENYITRIKNKRVEFKIIGKNPADFPEFPVYETMKSITLKADELRNMIRHTLFSISTDSSRLVFTGGLLEVRDNIANLVTVDGFRISVSTGKTENTSNEEIEEIIPGKSLGDLLKVLPDDKEQSVEIIYTGNQLVFVLHTFIFVTRLLNGEFLKYENNFTDDYNTKVTVDKNQLIQSFERAMLITEDTKKNPVYLNIQDDVMAVSSQTEAGTILDELLVETEGEEINISFNPKYLYDPLKVIDDDKVSLYFTNSLSPCIIKGEENQNYKFLVLPLRLK